MSFSPSLLDKIRGATSLSALVSGRVTLKGHGKEKLGLCPFHNEKGPSFTVNETKGVYRCWGCDAAGDAFAWLMATRNLTFPESVEELARAAGIEIPRQPETQEDKAAEARRATLLEALEAAALHYQAELGGEHGKPALAYLAARGIGEAMIAAFRIGWARPGGSLRFGLTRDRFPDALLIEAGLKREMEDGRAVDFFRGRIMLPIADGKGKIVGFGARTLGDEKPKYLNSPASDLFDKGSLLYGLDRAREGAGKANRLVFVEGYFDVIGLNQAGVMNAVAPLGTALTPSHLQTGWKLADDLVVCLDGDAAGAKAMERTADRALDLVTIGKTIGFATMPEGVDPDELVRDRGKAPFEEVISVAEPLSAAVWAAAVRRHPPERGPEREAMLEVDLYRAASRIPDAILRAQILGDWRARLRHGWDRAPYVLIGRSSKNCAPYGCTDLLVDEWEWAFGAAFTGPAPRWLASKGVDWDGLEEQLGGVGQAHVRLVKGHWGDWWSDVPAPFLWEPGGDTSVLIFPEWEGARGGALLDLIAWDPRSETLASRTGRSIVAGAGAIVQARGFEARGLTHPVKVAETALSWLRTRAAGEQCALIVDWRSAWDALGGAQALLADSMEFAEELDRAIRPPALRRPAIKFQVSR